MILPTQILIKKQLQKGLTIGAMGMVGLATHLSISLFNLPASAQTALKSRTSAFQLNQLPAPPRTPPPNRTRSGGSLGDEQACQDGSESLVALVPIENPVLTTSAHPTFFFYVPYALAQVKFGEFSVLVGLNETRRLYYTQFTLPQTPGIVSISLPQSPEYVLEEGTFYHWYIKLYCQKNETSSMNIEVNAWVQRIASTAETDRQINDTTPDIWYDSLANLADRLQSSPQDQALRDRWARLLAELELESLAQEPLMGSVQLLEN